MPEHYQLLKPRLNFGPSTTSVGYTKYLLRILILFMFVQQSWTYYPYEKYIIVNAINF